MAEIVGKVDLKNIKSVKEKTQPQKPKPPAPPKGAKPQQKQLRRADDSSARREASTQQIAELQYIKGKLRKAEEAYAQAVNESFTLKHDADALVQVILANGTAEGVPNITSSEEFKRVVEDLTKGRA